MNVLSSQGAYDDITGLELDRKKVVEARKMEVDFINSKEVWCNIPRSMAVRNGWRVLKTRWIDINKGDDSAPLIRSGFVGKEYNGVAMDGLFAGMPPLEALRSLVSEASTIEDGDE